MITTINFKYYVFTFVTLLAIFRQIYVFRIFTGTLMNLSETIVTTMKFTFLTIKLFNSFLIINRFLQASYITIGAN
jgi:hypothetical protein